MKIHIVSTGRSGTTLLSNVASHFGVIMDHQQQGSRVLNILANMEYLGIMPSGVVMCYYKRFCDNNGVPRSTSDPLRSMAFLLWLRMQSSPRDIAVLHIVRDKKSFIDSFMRWKNSSVKRFVLHHIMPLWTPVNRPLEMMKAKGWLSKRDHFALVWERKNQMFEEIKSLNVAKYQRISFEDIVSGDEKSVQTLAELFNVEERKVSDLVKKLGKVNKS
jgi:hypothetical protein